MEGPLIVASGAQTKILAWTNTRSIPFVSGHDLRKPAFPVTNSHHYVEENTHKADVEATVPPSFSRSHCLREHTARRARGRSKIVWKPF
jgi:hypothetical protein